MGQIGSCDSVQPIYNVIFQCGLVIMSSVSTLDKYVIRFPENLQDYVSYINHLIQLVSYGFGME